MGREYAKCTKGECTALKWDAYPDEEKPTEYYAACASSPEKPCIEDGAQRCACFVILYEAVTIKGRREPDRTDLESFNLYLPPGKGKPPPSGCLPQSVVNKRNKDAKAGVVYAAYCACCKLQNDKPYFRD
jgi:hypothetical protein